METFILIGITGIGLGALYFLIASGLSLIYGLMGVLNFAHGSFLSVGAFAGFWVASQMGFETTLPEFLLAMIVGGLAAGLFALLVEQLLISRLYEIPGRKSSRPFRWHGLKRCLSCRIVVTWSIRLPAIA